MVVGAVEEAVVEIAIVTFVAVAIEAVKAGEEVVVT